MFRSYEFEDRDGKTFHARLEIDENSKAFNRLVNRLANRARGSKKRTATLGDGAIKLTLKEAE